ncbi:pilus assembly protein TadG-related protein [Streptomyces amakusaensis]
MVVGLLFLALAFFAVGQAGASRGGTQSGADAAALAAARESRDSLGEDLAAGILDPDFLRDFLDGRPKDSLGTGCDAAGRFAEANGTLVGECFSLGDGRWGYTVAVDARESIGDTVLPGTENFRAEAMATAVVEPRCTFRAAKPPEPSEPAEPSIPSEPSEPTEPSEPPEPVSPGTLDCDGGESFDLDPQQPDRLPDMSDLFTVRLDGD